MDVTVSRVAPDAFLVVTGTASGRHDLAWLRGRARATGSAVRIADVSGRVGVFRAVGPAVAGRAGPAHAGGPVERGVPVPDHAGDDGRRRPGAGAAGDFVGELGWELYCPTEYGLALWRALVASGSPHGLRAGGYRAIESLRLEKGYRVWGSDVTRDTTPDEAGLGFAVRRAAGTPARRRWRRARASGPARRLRCLVLDDPRAVALGGAGAGGVGRRRPGVTSGGYGYTVERSIAYALLPVEVGRGTAVQVQVDGGWVDAEVVRGPLYDPRNERVRA